MGIAAQFLGDAIDGYFLKYSRISALIVAAYPVALLSKGCSGGKA